MDSCLERKNTGSGRFTLEEDTMDGSDYVEISEVCRICIGQRANVSIFETHDMESEELLGYSVVDRIMSFACVEIQLNDGLPSKICHQCLKQINQAFKLKAQCEYADATLRELCSDDHPADKESNESPVEVLDPSDGFKMSNNVSQIESVQDLSIIISENDEDMLNAQCQIDVSEEVSEGVVEVEPFLGHEENRSLSSAVKQIHGQTKQSCDKATKRIPSTVLKQVVEAETAIACAECGEEFSNKKKLEEHGFSQPGHRPFLCEFCGKTFKRLSNMKEHEKLHSGVKQFLCSDCGELATGKKYHYCMALRDKASKGHSCNICGKRFVSRSSLGTHKKRHGSQSKFKCQECNKLYFSKQELERHLRVHFNIRPFNCPDESCSLTFYSQGELNRHLRYHDGLRRFSCDKCGQKFFESGHLASHQRKHTGERPYTCQSCPKSFIDSSKLRRHSLAHKKSSYRQRAKVLRNVNTEFSELEIVSGQENCNVALEITVPQEDDT